MNLNSGTIMPRIGFGTGSALMKATDDNNIDEKRVDQIKKAISLGYRHFDCAQAYNTERELGAAIRESGISRENFFVTTKALGVAPISKGLDSSLEKLDLEYVDLYLLHTPWFENTKPLKEAWKEMESVKASGKAKAIGVSNFLIPHLEKVLENCIERPAVNQYECSLYLQRNELFEYCQKHNIIAEAFGSLTPCNGTAGSYDSKLLTSLADKYNVSESEICIRWCMDKGMAVVTTSFKEERLKKYLSVEDFRLTAQETEGLSQACEEKHVRKYFTNRFGAEDRS